MINDDIIQEHGIKQSTSSVAAIIDFQACLLPVNRDCSFPRGYGGIHAVLEFILNDSRGGIKRPS